jgi:hypothetical protein
MHAGPQAKQGVIVMLVYCAELKTAQQPRRSSNMGCHLSNSSNIMLRQPDCYKQRSKHATLHAIHVSCARQFTHVLVAQVVPGMYL